MTFKVPGYRLDRRLGQGSQGEVWLAEHTASGDRVALKWIELGRPEAAEVARAEAALLARLDHPNLIALREFRICDGGFVLVLELADAGSLAKLLRRRDKLTPSEVVATVSPVAAALAHAHDRGVLHGDVSPANILFTAAGHPKLADLGVARLVAGVGTGIGLGTPAYLDPMIAAGGVPGITSDVFSLAAVTLHALTGAGPWRLRGVDQPSADQVVQFAATGQIEDLAGRLATVPPAMSAVLTRALNRDPIRRGTAAEFALDIRAALPPTPVVLAGGRITAPVGRHAARHRSSEPAGQDPGVGPAVAGAGRPEPSRWGATGSIPAGAAAISAGFVPTDLTRISRPLVRASAPVHPEPESRGAIKVIVDRMVGGAALRAVAVLALLGLLVAAGVIGWPLLRHRDQAAAAPSTTGSGRSGSSPMDPVAILTRLDDLRAQAFAERRPELLAQVYAAPALLAADTATLKRSVPSGCRLTGLHTDYRQPRVLSRAGGSITLTVMAALPPATLACPGRPDASTPPVATQALAITLTVDAGTTAGAGPGADAGSAAADRYRIASQTAG